MTFRARLASELQYQNKTQSDLARYLDTRQSTVGSWLQRDTMPAADTVLKIAEFLNVSYLWLITGKEPAEVKQISRTQITENYSQEEKLLIQKYRAISDHDKNMVKTVLDTAYQACSQSDSVKSEIV